MIYNNELISDDYKKGWYDGYQQAKKEVKTPTQNINGPTVSYPPHNSCSVCGLIHGNYVCAMNNCPRNIRSSVSVTTAKDTQTY